MSSEGQIHKTGKLKIGIVGRQTLNQQVYETLKMAILDGNLKPDSKLNEVQVAEELNVSPTPVREAFRMLAAEGLVEIIPWKGAVVRKFSDDEVLEVYQCREALEVLAVHLAINKINDEDIKLLNDYITLSEEIEDISELVEINTKIHSFILNKSENKKLRSLLKTLDDVLLHDRNISAYDTNRRKEILNEHIELLNALKEKDAKRAENAIREHIRNGYLYIERKLQDK